MMLCILLNKMYQKAYIGHPNNQRPNGKESRTRDLDSCNYIAIRTTV